MSIDTNLRPEGGGRNIPLGSLRTALTLLVVAHHAALAYHPYAPPPARTLAGSLIWTAFPIVDTARWSGSGLFVGFNDVFFMSLMFLVSGVFAWPSLVRRGAVAFAQERALKLGAPFVVSAALFSPLAYYATFVATGADASPFAFARQWLALGAWPAGPAWFLWVLLAFGLAAAAMFALGPGWGAALGRLSERLAGRPALYGAALVAASALAYLPMAAAFTPEHWTMVGPFSVQTSRLFHYLVYFLAGAGLGACGLGRGLLSNDGALSRRWPLWIAAALFAYVFAIAMFLVIISTLEHGGPGLALGTLGNFAFVLSCACSSLAMLALFVRFSRRSGRAWTSLGANAYGIYLLHYFCVSWLQLALLRAPLSGFIKFVLVLAGAAAISWALSATLRRIPAVARVV
jgi:peptidoglycan/LPS O-acetylase OafA/YrhL